MGQIFAAFGGQGKIGAAKELGTDDLLQLLDPVADRAGRDAQLFSRLGDAVRSRASASNVSRHWMGGMRLATPPGKVQLLSAKALFRVSRTVEFPAEGGSAAFMAGLYLKITVLWPLSSTRCSLCHLTARASTWLSVSRPIAVRSSTVLLWSARATSCSMIGPSSRSAVT